MKQNELLRLEFDFNRDILSMGVQDRLDYTLHDMALREFYKEFGVHATTYEEHNDVDILTHIKLDGPTVVVSVTE